MLAFCVLFAAVAYTAQPKAGFAHYRRTDGIRYATSRAWQPSAPPNFTAGILPPAEEIVFWAGAVRRVVRGVGPTPDTTLNALDGVPINLTPSLVPDGQRANTARM